MDDYEGRYSEESFWKKVKQYGLVIGREALERVLTMYYCLIDPDTPKRAKGTITAALGYFILPHST